MIQVTKSKVSAISAAHLIDLRNEFADKHCVIFREFFAPDLVTLILTELESAQFYCKSHTDDQAREFASDLTIRENEKSLHLIHFLLNNPRIFLLLQEITGCLKIGSFGGRIYRNLPRPDHRLEWHDDTDHSERLLGISINLSPEPFAGGTFQLRQPETGQIVCEVPSGSPGDAHVFRISRQLQHRVTAVAGETPRTSAAGWFLSAPDCRTALRNLVRSNCSTESSAS